MLLIVDLLMFIGAFVTLVSLLYVALNLILFIVEWINYIIDIYFVKENKKIRHSVNK